MNTIDDMDARNYVRVLQATSEEGQRFERRSTVRSTLSQAAKIRPRSEPYV
jgi:hypothetical protein